MLLLLLLFVLLDDDVDGDIDDDDWCATCVLLSIGDNDDIVDGEFISCAGDSLFL